VGVDEGTHRKTGEITMATLKSRGAKVNISEKAVVSPQTKTAIYRGVTYDPTERKKAATKAKSGIYRGSPWEA
jgi:hypothetical protein